MEATELAALIRDGSYNWTNERELQEAIAERLRSCRVSFSRETGISRGERPDFMAGGVAIEVKVAGTRAALLRQLMRYAREETVTGLVLATDKLRLSDMPATLNSKPLSVATLVRL